MKCTKMENNYIYKRIYYIYIKCICCQDRQAQRIDAYRIARAFSFLFGISRITNKSSQRPIKEARVGNLYSWLASINRCCLKFIRIITTCRVKDCQLVIDDFGLCPDIRLSDNQTFIDVKTMIDVRVPFPTTERILPVWF